MRLWNEYMLENNHRTLQVLSSLERSVETTVMGFLSEHGK